MTFYQTPANRVAGRVNRTDVRGKFDIEQKSESDSPLAVVVREQRHSLLVAIWDNLPGVIDNPL